MAKYLYKDGTLREAPGEAFDSPAIFEQLKAVGVKNYKATLTEGGVVIEVDKSLSAFEQTQLKNKLDTMDVEKIKVEGEKHE